MSEWQPIETAPKDGRPIIFGGRRDRWGDPFTGAAEDYWMWSPIVFYERPDRRYKGQWSSWETGEKVLANDLRDDSNCITYSHWVPLPDPPEPPQ